MSTTYPTTKQTFTNPVAGAANDPAPIADGLDTVAALEDAVGYPGDARSAAGSHTAQLKELLARAQASSTAPLSPVANDTWLDTSGTPYVLKVWTGSAWQTLGGASLGTPAVVLGTAAAAGSAATAIRTDATIVAFDATVPSTQAIGDSAAVGSAAVAARRDHKHAMPAFGTGSTNVTAGNDSRLSNSRTPTGSASGDLTGTYPGPTIATGAVTDTKVAAANKDGTTATPSLRTLGTGATQAAAGNHSHGGGAGDATSLQGVAIQNPLTTTDGYVLTYVSGSSQLELAAPTGGGGGGSGFPYPFTTPPNTASWTTRNFTSSTLTDISTGAVAMKGAGSGSHSVRLACLAAPATPYTITAWFHNGIVGTGNRLMGLGFHSTSDDKITGIFVDGATPNNLYTGKFTSSTSYSANYAAITDFAREFWCLRVTNDGSTHRTYQYSTNGVNFLTLTDVTATDFHTPDEVCWFVDGAGITSDLWLTLLSWEVT